MIRQRTIKETVTIEGAGLQTGAKVTMTLKSSPANSGINFIRTDLPNKPLLNLQSMDFSDPASSNMPERRTTLIMGPLQIQTTEHFLAALSGFGIDNIVAELSGLELPGLDGSARGFLDNLKKAGRVEQDAPKKMLKVDKAVWCRTNDSILIVLPYDHFKISYTLSYDNPFIGNQFFSVVLDEESFANEVAPARTFCLEAEALELLKRGLGKGSSYDNTLVIGKDGPVNTRARFPDEPVRHKVLDLIGDLYMLGMPIQGHVVAVKSGHRLNMEMVRRLKLE